MARTEDGSSSTTGRGHRQRRPQRGGGRCPEDYVDADFLGVTHLLQMEATDDIAEAIGDFLRP